MILTDILLREVIDAHAIESEWTIKRFAALTAPVSALRVTEAAFGADYVGHDLSGESGPGGGYFAIGPLFGAILQ
jgi:hypothetical protein